MSQEKSAMESRFVDQSAPFLMRPSTDDPADGRNWVLKAIARTGQDAGEACHTWAGAFALGNGLIWQAMVEYRGETEAAEAYEAAWARIPEIYRDGARQIFTFASARPPYGLALEIETPEMVERSGLSVEELLIFWNKAFVAQDHEMW